MESSTLEKTLEQTGNVESATAANAVNTASTTSNTTTRVGGTTQGVTALDSSILGDTELMAKLDPFSIEGVVEAKISRFFDQIGTFYPENVYDLIMSKVEKPLLNQILRRVGGNQVHASRILGINRNTLRKKMKIYGL
jgi:Fis family transcriptional regulator